MMRDLLPALRTGDKQWRVYCSAKRVLVRDLHRGFRFATALNSFFTQTYTPTSALTPIKDLTSTTALSTIQRVALNYKPPSLSSKGEPGYSLS